MRMLEDQDCSEWLQTQNIIAAPYGRSECPTRYCAQFRLPETPRSISHIARCLVETYGPFDTALLQFTDWPLYEDEMAIITALRNAHGGQRPLIETPGHLFSFDERDLLIGMFSLAICYQWTAYLYFKDATVLCWEGELLDAWSNDDSRMAAIREIFM